jgi:hypothetical protein
MNAVSGAVNKTLHLGIPFVRGVAKMNGALRHLF